MKLDHDALMGEPYAVAANLPYNVGTALLVRWLSGRGMAPRWTSLTLMSSRKSRSASSAPPGTGATAGSRCWAVAIAGQAGDEGPSQRLHPPPKVMSAVVHIEPAQQPPASPRACSRRSPSRVRAAPQDAAPEPQGAARRGRGSGPARHRLPTARRELRAGEFVAMARGLRESVIQLIGNPSAGGTSSAHRTADRAFEELGATVHTTKRPSAAADPGRRDERVRRCRRRHGAPRASQIARSGHPVALRHLSRRDDQPVAREAGYRGMEGLRPAGAVAEPRRRHYPVALGDGWFFACAGVGPDSLAVARVLRGSSARSRRLA